MRSAILIAILLVTGSATAQTFEPFQILRNPIPEDAQFGYSVVNIGDVDGNGVNDYMVGAPGDFVQTSSRARGTIRILKMQSESAILSIENLNRPLGEVDSLGRKLKFIRNASENDPGQMVVWGTRWWNPDASQFPNTFLPWRLSLNESGSEPEFSLFPRELSYTSLGDINGDGSDDFFSVSQDYASSQNLGTRDIPGRIGLYLSDQDDFELRKPLAFTRDWSSNPLFGLYGATVGDLDGDEIPEIALSAKNAIWIVSLNSDLDIAWTKTITAESLGLAPGGTFGENLTSLDSTGQLAPLLVTSPGSEAREGSLHLLRFGPDAEVVGHDIIKQCDFPSNNGFDFDEHIDVSVETVDHSSGDVTLLLGTPFADVRAEDTGAIHLVELNSELEVTPIFSISNETLDIQEYGRGFNDEPYLIGDMDGNGYEDLESQGTVYFLDSDTRIIRSSPLVPEFQTGHPVGDLNGDGIDDVVFTPNPVDGWARLVYLDSNGEVGSFFDLRDESGGLLEGLLSNDFNFGQSVARIGDVDGNGVRDLAISEPGVNRSSLGFIYVLFLDAQGRPTSVSTIELTAADGDELFTRYGMYLTDIGDVDDDGIPDLALGLPGNGSITVFNTGSGAVHIIFLNSDGTQKSITKNSRYTGYEDIFTGGDKWGWIEGIGDLDKDGTQDLLMGSHEASGSVVRGLKVLFMSPDGFIRTYRSITNLEGPFVDLFSGAFNAGHRPQRLWDINGDGVDEIIVSYSDETTFRKGPIVLSLASILGAEISLISQGPEVSQAGVDLSLQAEVRSLGGGEISQVDVNLRVAGQENFLALKMDHSDGVNWSATIPGFLLTGQGLEYYVSASEGGRADFREPPRGVISVPVTVASGIEHVVQSGVEEDGYQLISVPFELEDPSANTLLESSLGEYDESSWRFFEARSNLSELSQTLISIDPGSAYWMISRAQQFVDWGRGTSVPTDKVFSVRLPSGWSFFGSPFNFELDSSLLATKSAGSLDIRRYDGAWLPHTDSTLVPFEGYAIHNGTGSTDTLYVAPSAEVALISGVAGFQVSKSAGEAEWSIPIHARMGRARDIDNVAVVGSSLLNRADPPPVGDYVRLAFEGGDYPLSTFAQRAETGLKDWTFTVSSRLPGSVTVRFPDLGEVPVEYAVTLVDPVTGIRQNLRTSPSYTLASGGEGSERTLRLEVDSNGFVDEVLPTELALKPAFPNPFAGSTTLSYSLPETSFVELEVFDILGRRIATLAHTEKNAGNHVAVWDGTTYQGNSVSPGLYFVKMTTPESTITTTVIRSNR